jgi:serpin B
MTYAGARGQTAEQMAKTMHFSLEPQRLDQAFGALLHELNGAGKRRDYELHAANVLWGQKGHRFLPEFLKVTRDAYGAPLHEVDFAATEQARQAINTWVEHQTKDKIRDLIAQGVLSPETRLVLTNAIYFKGKWEREFKKSLTHDQPFHVTADRDVQVPLMNQTENFKYLDAVSFQALELPYKGKDLSMVVFLPRKVNGLAEFEKSFTTGKALDALSHMRQDKVRVTLPRFKMTQEFELARVLSDMGMPSAFRASAADFSGMDGQRDLLISAVIHKAFVDVNEEGTEAAAATAVGIRATAVRITPVFRADHPFVFLIRDNHSGNILFLGRVVEPKK